MVCHHPNGGSVGGLFPANSVSVNYAVGDLLPGIPFRFPPVRGVKFSLSLGFKNGIIGIIFDGTMLSTTYF